MLTDSFFLKTCVHEKNQSETPSKTLEFSKFPYANEIFDDMLLCSFNVSITVHQLFHKITSFATRVNCTV